MHENLVQYCRTTIIQAVAACTVSINICLVLAWPANANDNQLIFSFLKLIDVPEFSAKGIEQRLKEIFKFHEEPQRYDPKDLPSHVSDPYFWTISSLVSRATATQQKKFLLACSRIGRGALAAGPRLPPSPLDRPGELNLPGVWPVGEKIVFPKDAIARLDCTVVGISRDDTKFDLTAMVKDLGHLFSDVGKETTKEFFGSYDRVFASGGKGDPQKRLKSFKMTGISKTVDIQFSAWLLAPSS